MKYICLFKLDNFTSQAMTKNLLLCLLCIGTAHPAVAQTPTTPSFRTFFRQAVLLVDTLSFRYPQDTIRFRQEPHLPFYYNSEEQVAELRLTPADTGWIAIRKLSLAHSADYDLIDSILWVNDSEFRLRLRFRAISRSDFLQLTFAVSGPADTLNLPLRLFPYTRTNAIFYPGNDDLYIGEEKSFELITNNLANLRLDGVWKQQGQLEYRLFERDGQGFISVVPRATGTQRLRLAFETARPFIGEQKELRYAVGEQEFSFTVRESRLRFQRIDQREIVRERDNREGVEIQLDNDRLLEMQKTYRIEDREERGGPLVAELFTVRRLSNDRVLCILRPYLYHRVSDGYLFIKDGDQPRFLTNINILPEARISTVSILREGRNWTTERFVRPGETVEVRIEGEGLSQARFAFEDLEDVSPDTITRNDRAANYVVRIPLNIRKSTIEIYNQGRRTGVTLNVREFERPRPLDFVFVDYGEGPKPANAMNQLILYPHAIRDVVLSFDPFRIDSPERLYGRQILEIEVRISGARNELVEMLSIPHLEICPEQNSPRAAFYQSPNCNRQDIPLNSRLSRKTHSLDDWSRIEITIRHKRERYSGEGYTQRIEIVRQKLVTFDLDLSFPAGLIIKKIGEEGFPGLGGISLAMIAQFTFFDKEQVRRPKPFKIGAGFLAQNAFNFNPDVRDRDLGLVVIGSLYPTRKDSKLNFPLYGGGGYFLNQSKFFFLIGPGIRVNF